jgi:hypothetical protein
METKKSSDDICLECGHRRGYHDGAGCAGSLPNGAPCPCRTCVDMPSSEPHQLNQRDTGLGWGPTGNVP